MNRFRQYVCRSLLVMMVVFQPQWLMAENAGMQLTREESSAILQELKNIRSVLERMEKNSLVAQKPQPVAPAVASISSAGRPALGKENAPVTIVEVSDYQCPYCKRFADGTLKELKEKYIDTGKVRFVFKDLPLDFHQHARTAALAAHCARDQGKYWQMHDQLFANNNSLDSKSIAAYAKNIQLEMDKFSICMSSNRHLNAINKDVADAGKAGLTGTPSFVIGKTTSDVINGPVVRGAMPLSVLEQHINKNL